MTITPAVRIAEKKLVVKDRTILTNVPDDVIATSGSASVPVEGVFLGAEFHKDNSRHVVSLGTLRDVRFMACFRFKLWWIKKKRKEKLKFVKNNNLINFKKFKSLKKKRKEKKRRNSKKNQS